MVPCTAGAALVMLLAAGAATACIMPEPVDLEDVFRADLVVVARVEHQGAVQRPASQTGIGAYPRFSLAIREVLSASSGLPPTFSDITVAFSEYPYGVPDALTVAGPRGVLVALDLPDRDAEPGRVFPPNLYILHQDVCAEPLIFDMDSLVAIALHQVLLTGRDKETEWSVLSDFLFKNGADGAVQRKLMRERLSAP